MYDKLVNFSVLLGKTLTKIERQDNDAILFYTSDGEEYSMHHERDCCESVVIEDIAGDLNDLIGTPILQAEESTNKDINPEGVPAQSGYQESFTWTFYKLATVNGYVTIRWYGGSNGYYSEGVDFFKMK